MVVFGSVFWSVSWRSMPGLSIRPDRKRRDMKERITWPMVALVSVILAAIVALSLADVDTQVVTNVLIALGIGGVYGGVQAVRSNTNGTLSDMMRTMQAGQADMMRLVREAVDRLSKSPAIKDE